MEKFVISPHVRALIFDCDGTIADTMPLHYTAYQKVLGDKAGLFTREMFYEQAGVPAVRVMELLREEHGLKMDAEKTGMRKETIYGEMLAEGAVRPVAAVEAVVREYAGKYPMAVASGGTRENVVMTLKSVGLSDFFPVVVSADDVERGKPAPDMFLKAARQLRVDARACLVFEDGEMGFRAAEAAGMEWVDVRDWYEEGEG